jgi:hypothetical protein
VIYVSTITHLIASPVAAGLTSVPVLVAGLNAVFGCERAYLVPSFMIAQ